MKAFGLGCGIALGLVGLTGCGTGKPEGPPRIRYGETPCGECRMLISEERFAAALRSGAGEERAFDGIGCLLRHLAASPQRDARIWVHDYESGQWVDAHAAFFVSSQALSTPMGEGIVAVSTTEQAARLATSVHGDVARFTQLAGLVQTNESGGTR